MRTFIFILVLCLSFLSKAQHAKTAPSISFEQLDKMLLVEEKPVVLFLHTSWCMYCQTMLSHTFTDPIIKQLLDEQFYFISFDAESREPVTFKGVRFEYLSTGRNVGLHQMAIELGESNKGLEFPMLVVFNSRLEISFQHSGFLDANQMELILKRLINN